jgi:hypothetical protein
VRIRYPREIHIWGGFGSQLYGLALALDIREKYPKLGFKLVFHTSGVTERQLEIESLLDKMSLDYDKKFDFVNHKPIGHKSGFKNRLIQLLGKTSIGLLQASRLVARCNYRTDVRAWTIQIRGHYAYRNISEKTLENIAGALGLAENISISDIFLSRITVHYRLGDLLSLSNKSEIEFERLFSAIQRELKRNPLINQLFVLTDSQEACRARFKSMSLVLEELGIVTTIVSESSVNTILSGIYAQCFIGTNSKISFWIVYLRSLLKPFAEEIISYIPIENTKAIQKVIKKDNTRNQVLYF